MYTLYQQKKEQKLTRSFQQMQKSIRQNPTSLHDKNTQTGKRKEQSQPIKGHLKPPASILHAHRLKAAPPLRSGTGTRQGPLPLLLRLNIALGVLGGKRNRRHSDQEEVKLSLFTDFICRKTKESSKNKNPLN